VEMMERESRWDRRDQEVWEPGAQGWAEKLLLGYVHQEMVSVRDPQLAPLVVPQLGLSFGPKEEALQLESMRKVDQPEPP
jgi:hypothetical protein